jgi:prolipoprotein diacylglyceryltransferase
MPEVLNIGPFLVKWEWLVIAIAIFIGYKVMLFKLRQEVNSANKIGDIYFNAVLIVVMSWKFTPALLNPSILFDNWLNLLYVTGTTKHILIGIGGAIIFLIFQSTKYKISIWVIIDAFPFGFLPLMIIFHAFVLEYGLQTDIIWGISAESQDFNYHPVNFYKLILSLLLFVWIWRSKFKVGTGLSFSYFVVLYGLMSIIVSFFQSQLIAFGGLSIAQLQSIIVVLIGLLVKTFKKSA